MHRRRIDPHPSFGLWCRRSLRPGAMAEHHAHADLEWGFVVRGSLRYRTGGRDVLVPPRRLLLFWAGLPHQSHQASADIVFLVGVAPLPLALTWNLDPAALDRLMAGDYLLGREDRHGDDERLLLHWCDDFASNDPAHADCAALELRARIARLLHGESASAPAEVPSVAVRRMVEHLIRHHREPLTVEDAAGAAGLNPKYAFAAFRRHTGFTPRHWLESYRVAQAQRHLVAGADPLQAAMLAGFQARRTFYSAFTAQVGATPTAWLRGARRNLSARPGVAS